MKISYYASLTQRTSNDTIPISDFLNAVKFGKWQDQVLKVRNAKTTAEQKAEKLKLPSVIMAGIFNEPKDASCQQHSGLIAIDFDELDDMPQAKEALKADRYSYAVSVSVRGHGLFVVVQIDGQKHRQSFRQLADYYRNTYGLIVDASGINEARRRFVSYDPDLFVNEKAARFVAKPEKKQKPQKPFIALRSNSDRIIRELVDGNINITESYDDWIKVGMALKNEYGDEGLHYWVALSQISDKYKPGQCERKWPTFNGNGRVSFASIAWMAAANGIEIKDQRTKDVERFISAQGKKREPASEQAAKVMGIEPLTEDEWKAVQELPDNIEITEGKVSKIIQAKVWVEKNCNLWRCGLTSRIYNGKDELTDPIINTIWINLAKSGIDISVNNVWAICTEAGLPEKNEIVNYLESVQTPGMDAIVQMVESINFKHDELSKQLCTMWLTATVQTLLSDNPLPYMLVFTGKQNTGKTEWFRRLLPEKLKHWMVENTLDQGKDSEKLMCENWIILNDEYKGSTTQDVTKLKDMLSKNYFTLRPPYGRSNMRFRRIATLCGTSNETSLLYDHTGNRRIFPLEVLSINFEKCNAVDRDRFWGQLYNAWKNEDLPLHLSPEMQKRLERLSDEYTEFDIIYHVMNENYTPDQEGWQSVTDVHLNLSTLLPKERITTKRIGMEAKRLNWETHSKKVNGKTQRGYKISKAQSKPYF